MLPRASTICVFHPATAGKLSGGRAGQYSVRVNDQWRLCFTWSTPGAANVELVDYH